MIQGRLLQIDSIIFENVCLDVFNKSKNNDENKGELSNLVHQKLF